MRNHGLLACGRTIAQAFSNIFRLERACETQLRAMACTSAGNARLVHLPPDVIARTNAQLASSPTPDAKGRTLPQGTIEWPALKRMLDRRDASYKM